MRFSHKLYYGLKPYVPWRIRMAVRRQWARRVREENKTTWPIDPAAGKTPANWPGWPEGKHLAFVITHDVEGPDGLAKVRELAALEMSLGFRSSFNFIPEGPYAVSSELRSWLVTNGFEVGVHDLNHDGKLYFSREDFRRKAHRINSYLQEWKAVGYRSGFMLRYKDWHRDLRIAYDATSFDTDPFEPLPEGAGTIFPFWVENVGGLAEAAIPRPRDLSKTSESDPKSCGLNEATYSKPRGYVELPYTLPQDSTLFLLLQEKSPEIWIRKLGWIAERRGMALVNVHPDYLSFGTEKSARCFPSNYYRNFLLHLSENYRGRYWHVLPHELATWYERASNPGKTLPPMEKTMLSQKVTADNGCPAGQELKGKRIGVLLYSYYPSDPRPRRAAEAMVEAGAEVDLICLREDKQEPVRERISGVEVRRLPLGKNRGGKMVYLAQYASFLTTCFFVIAWRTLFRRYDVIHVHNMPDILVFAALPARLRGARVILDLHDPMPELMTSIYQLKPSHWLVRILRTCERWSIGFASIAITPNITFKNLFTSRSCRSEKMEIVMNSPQPDIFDPDQGAANDEPRARNGQFRIMHHGSIVHRHGIDLLVTAVASLRKQIPGIQLDIYGAATSFLDEVLALADQLGVKEIVHYHGAKPQDKIAAAIRECDLGVVPNRRSPFTETNFPTRLFEYLSMHRPVLAPLTQGIKDYFEPDEILYFNPDDGEDLARQILWSYQHPEIVAKRVQNGISVYRRHLWTGEKARLVAITAGLAHA